MNLRRLGLALALLAAAVFGLAVRPAWVEAERVREAELRSRQERREARAALMRLERGRGRVVTAASSSLPPGAAGARLVRRQVLNVIAAAEVHGVVLEVQARDAQAPAQVRLTADGEFVSLAELAGRLASPEGGVVLEQVRLLNHGSAQRLELQGTGWSAPH